MTPITYSLEHANATVYLSLTDQRFIARTQGKGLLDKPRTIDISLSDLKNFCLVPTIAAQNLVGQNESDYSYDSEFIFSYDDNGKLNKKRVFVNSRDEAFRKFLEALARACPAASLLHLEPAEAQRQIGVINARKTVYIIIGLIVGVPIIIALIVIISKILGG
ncbi:MAG: hypothetical protein AUG51_00710 [Acidobacteria bacterium 13_1_20CM_3_53_8]|nr:MAG: hypothetical protein AUG51_00710 [Acidobacteria bacterium 13_1_20CM_3_53_8]